MPVLDAWATPPPDGFPNYPAGTWGPRAAKELIARGGREFFAARCQRSKPRNRGMIGIVDRPDNVLSDEMRQNPHIVTGD
jgi:Glucose-6-phosphate dehydrogenase, C-terminal domain